MTSIELGCKKTFIFSFHSSVISWYIVAVKHSIYTIFVKLETDTGKNPNPDCNVTRKQQLMELISDTKPIVNS